MNGPVGGQERRAVGGALAPCGRSRSLGQEDVMGRHAKVARRRGGVAAGWLAALALVVVMGTGTTPAQAGSWADSLLAEHSVDFGAVPRGAKVRHNFVFQNRLNELVNIIDVHASCGCTSGRAGASAVPPGGSTVIEAEMDTRNFVGPKATTLTLTLVTASGRQAKTQINVRSNILADVVLNPGSVDFGAVGRGQTPQQVLSLERLGRPDWKFERLLASESLCRFVTAEITEKYRNAEGVGYQLVVRLKPDAPSGVVREEIRLVTNDRETPVVPVLVTGQVQGTLQASPAVLSLGAVASSAPVKARFIVRGTQPFTITRIEGNGDGFMLAPADATPKALHILNLTYSPDMATTRGDIRHPFRVSSSLPGEPPVDLMATLSVAP
jgi:hypothetical protein